MDRRTDPRVPNGLLEAFWIVLVVIGVGCLPGPNGKRLRRVRNAGMPVPGVVPPLVLGEGTEAGLAYTGMLPLEGPDGLRGMRDSWGKESELGKPLRPG